MSLSAQAKFLRVLQEREFQRLGGTRLLKANIRVIAATNRDLRKAVERGDFREDLFYRLGVFDIQIPPLRDRAADIVPLSETFLQEIGRTFGRPPAGLTREARSALLQYEWPGNVRELRNVLERAAILCEGALIDTDHLALQPARSPATTRPISMPSNAPRLPRSCRTAAATRRRRRGALACHARSCSIGSADTDWRRWPARDHTRCACQGVAECSHDAPSLSVHRSCAGPRDDAVHSGGEWREHERGRAGPEALPHRRSRGGGRTARGPRHPGADGSGRPGDRRPGHGVSRRGRGPGAGVDGRRPRLRVPPDSGCPAVAHAHRSRPVVWHSRPGPARARRGLRAARALREPLRPKEPPSRVSREAGRHPGRAHCVGDHDRGHPPV